MSDRLPARAVGLEVAEFDDELVVLDPATRRAHHLDSSLAVVFDACDGTTTATDLAAEIAGATGSTVDAGATAWVARAVEILRTHQLVDPAADPSP